MDKPCAACPWVSKAARDVEATEAPATQQAMQAGQWFCCHVNMGTCHGAVLRHKAFVREQNKGEN